jgi:hypothetical protein
MGTMKAALYLKKAVVGDPPPRNSESRSRPIRVRRSNVVAEGRTEGLVAVVELDRGGVNMGEPNYLLSRELTPPLGGA